MDKNIDELIDRWLEGKSSPEEAEMLDFWLAEDEKHVDYFFRCKNLYDVCHPAFEPNRIDEKKAWGKVVPLVAKRRWLSVRWSVAAAVVLLCIGLSGFWLISLREDVGKIPVATVHQEIQPEQAEGITLMLSTGERVVLEESADTKVFSFKHSPQFEELAKVIDASRKLDHGIMKKDYESYKTFAGQIQNKDLREAYKAKLQARTKLMEGSPAIDFPFKDIDGKEYHLRDFKGKPIFIDIWATWCLPCLAQKPDFEKLSEQYPDIQFLGISIDQKIEWWKNKMEKDGMPEYVKEFIANPYDFDEEWDISSIPRFFLIDKDFKIINAFAPRPSEQDKIKPMLDAI